MNKRDSSGGAGVFGLRKFVALGIALSLTLSLTSIKPVTLISSGISSVLIYFISSSSPFIQSSSAIILSNLANGDILPLPDKQIVKSILPLLSTRCPIAKNYMLVTLSVFANQAEKKESLYKCGVVKILLPLLSHESPLTLQKNALNIIENLATENSNAVGMCRDGVVKHLLTILSQCQSECQEQIIRALRYLAVSVENRIPMYKDGVVSALLPILASPMFREDIVAALSSLSYTEENRIGMYKIGVVSKLLPLLQLESPLFQENAVLVFRNLAFVDIMKVPIYKDKIVTSLFPLLLNGTTVLCKQWVVATFVNLAYEVENRAPMYRDGIVAAVLPLLSAGKQIVAQEYIVRLFIYLARSKENLNLMYSEGVVSKIIGTYQEQFKNSTGSFKEKCRELLTIFSDIKDAQTEIEKSKIFEMEKNNIF